MMHVTIFILIPADLAGHPDHNTLSLVYCYAGGGGLRSGRRIHMSSSEGVQMPH